jgi:hypothetical protein
MHALNKREKAENASFLPIAPSSYAEKRDKKNA